LSRLDSPFDFQQAAAKHHQRRLAPPIAIAEQAPRIASLFRLVCPILPGVSALGPDKNYLTGPARGSVLSRREKPVLFAVLPTVRTPAQSIR
jgi:hypothetical protein